MENRVKNHMTRLKTFIETNKGDLTLGNYEISDIQMQGINYAYWVYTNYLNKMHMTKDCINPVFSKCATGIYCQEFEDAVIDYSVTVEEFDEKVALGALSYGTNMATQGHVGGMRVITSCAKEDDFTLEDVNHDSMSIQVDSMIIVYIDNFCNDMSNNDDFLPIKPIKTKSSLNTIFDDTGVTDMRHEDVITVASDVYQKFSANEILDFIQSVDLNRVSTPFILIENSFNEMQFVVR